MLNNALQDIMPALRVVNTFIAPTSVIAAAIMLYFCLQRIPRTVSIKLICALAISDMAFGITFILEFFKYDTDSFLCQLEATINTFFITLSMFLAVSISVFHYEFAKINPSFDQPKYFIKAIALSFLGSLIFTLGPVYSRDIIVMQFYNTSCFQVYDPSKPENDVIMAFFFMLLNLPAILAPIASLIFYILAIKRVRRTSSILFNEVSIETNKLYLYPAVLFLTLMPGIIVTLLRSFLDLEIPVALEVVNFILIRSVGLMNALTYGIQRKLYWRRINLDEQLVSRKEESDKSINWSSEDDSPGRSVYNKR